MCDNVGKVRRLSESSTDSEEEENSNIKDENTDDVSEMSDSDSDSDSSSSSSDSGSDSEDNDPGDISIGASPSTPLSPVTPGTPGSGVITPGPGEITPGSGGITRGSQQNLTFQEITEENTLISHQAEERPGCPVAFQGFHSDVSGNGCPVTGDQEILPVQSLVRSPGVRDQSLVSPDPDMFRKSQVAFSGDLDPMDLDLVASGQSDLHLAAPGQPDFSGQHSFQNLLEDISTDDNSDIPMMTHESDTDPSQLCNLNSQLETEFTTTAQEVCGADLLGTGEPGNFSQEDLLQLISTGGSGPGSGFLDPVFVDHEESQNAADLDQIVFEEGQEVDDEEDFLNDPRLGTICSGSNSMGNSEKGSINLNEFEDGELPSSPETSASKPVGSTINQPQQSAKSPSIKHSKSSPSSAKSSESKSQHSSSSKEPSLAQGSSSSKRRSRSERRPSKDVVPTKDAEETTLDEDKASGDKKRSRKEDTNHKNKSHKSSKSEQTRRSAQDKQSRDANASQKRKNPDELVGANDSKRKKELTTSSSSSSNNQNKSKINSTPLHLATESDNTQQNSILTSAVPEKYTKKSDKKSEKKSATPSVVPESAPALGPVPTERRSSSSSSRSGSNLKAHDNLKHRQKSRDDSSSHDDSKDRDAIKTHSKSSSSSSSKIKSQSTDSKRRSSDHGKHSSSHKSRQSSSSTDRVQGTPPSLPLDSNSAAIRGSPKPSPARSTSSNKSPRHVAAPSPKRQISPPKQTVSTPTTVDNKKPVKPPVQDSDPRTTTSSASNDPYNSTSSKPDNKLTNTSLTKSGGPIPTTPSTQTTNTCTTSKPPVPSTTVPSTLDSISSSPTSKKSAGSSGKQTPSKATAVTVVSAAASPKPSSVPSPASQNKTPPTASTLPQNEPEPNGANNANNVNIAAIIQASLPGKESPSSEPQESDDSSSNSGASLTASCGRLGASNKPSSRKKLSLKDYKLKKMAEKKDDSPASANSDHQKKVANAEKHKKIPLQNRQKSAKDMSTKPSVNVEPDTNDESNLDENNQLEGFDILDEVKDEGADETGVDDGMEVEGNTSDEDEAVFREVEKGVKKELNQEKEIVPESKDIKIVFTKDYLFNDILPTGWITVPHKSGMPVYFHKETRVVTLTPPYSLDHTEKVKHHPIPITAIPCANFKYLRDKEEKMKEQILQQQNQQPHSSAVQQPSSSSLAASLLADSNPSSSGETGGAAAATSNPDPDQPNTNQSNDGYLGCPFSGRDNVSPDSTTAEPTTANVMPTGTAPASQSGHRSSVIPGGHRAGHRTSDGQAGPSTSSPQEPMQVDGEQSAAAVPAANSNPLGCVIDNDEKKAFKPNEFQEYCKKLFKYDKVEVNAFETWRERRIYAKQQKKHAIRKNLVKEGTILITIPTIELAKIDKTQEGDSAINQAVVKKAKKQWVINPNGKSWVCLLNEMLQQSLKCSASFDFQELDNAANPYAATVYVNKIEYGTGIAPSKKLAKARAARQTLEIMIPDFKEKMKHIPDDGTADPAGDDSSEVAIFNDIRIEDPRIFDLSNKAGQQGPYMVLLSCLQKNYGLIETNVQHEMKQMRNQLHEYTMIVNNRKVSVICKNKKDGKQLASQKMLQLFHPQITNWGSLLRLYGKSRQILNKKKQKEHEVIALQLKNGNPSTDSHHSKAILEKLKKEMRNISEQRRNVIPLGKFHAPAGVNTTGLQTDHIDI